MAVEINSTFYSMIRSKWDYKALKITVKNAHLPRFREPIPSPDWSLFRIMNLY